MARKTKTGGKMRMVTPGKSKKPKMGGTGGKSVAPGKQTQRSKAGLRMPGY